MRWFLLSILCVNMDITTSVSCKSSLVQNLCDIMLCRSDITARLDNGDLGALLELDKCCKMSWFLSGNYAVGRLVALFYQIPSNLLTSPFLGLSIYANETQISTPWIPNTIITIQLPRELPVNEFHKLTFIMISLPPIAARVNSADHLYNNRLMGITVQGTDHVSGLQERVNISMNVTTEFSETHHPQCVFLNDSTQKFDTDGCLTQWEPGQNHIVCSCNHLTFFGVLMISNQEAGQVSQSDVKNLTYITFVGCSISFCALLVAILLFITNRKLISDVSMKIHVNLAIALLVLNMHFLPNTAAGIWEFSWPSPWLCFYMAIGLHFSLLASFCWMAVEGFHLYFLMVKVFNIYVKKYLLKVSAVGWGVPLVVVSVVIIINKDLYGTVSFDTSNSTQICFIRDDVVKVVTVIVLFSLVFLFNLGLLMVIVLNIVRIRKQFGPDGCNRTKKDVCTLLGVITLLGTTWGLIFFSFGKLTTIGLYAFCILNTLQGLFILVWFVMSVLKIRKASCTSTTTQSSQCTTHRQTTSTSS